MLNEDEMYLTALLTSEPADLAAAAWERLTTLSAALSLAVVAAEDDDELGSAFGVIPGYLRRIGALYDVVAQHRNDERCSALVDGYRRECEVAYLGLPKATARVLNAARVDFDTLACLSDDELMCIPGIGRGRVRQIRNAMRDVQS